MRAIENPTPADALAVTRVLAAQRPDSYIAGGVALNREGPRSSRDIDIFQDSQHRLETAAEADAKALTEADSGSRKKDQERQARRGGGRSWREDVPEWAADSAFRFFLRRGMSV